jgi:hypothetical protein
VIQGETSGSTNGSIEMLGLDRTAPPTPQRMPLVGGDCSKSSWARKQLKRESLASMPKGGSDDIHRVGNALPRLRYAVFAH